MGCASEALQLSVVPTEDDINVQPVQSYTLPPTECPVVNADGCREWTPLCDDKLKPSVGMKFKTLDDGANFYKAYASICGFTVRKATCAKSNDDMCVKYQYYVCSKEGFRSTTNTLKKRKRLSIRCGCNAKIVFKYCGYGNGYVVSTFWDGHTHSLYEDWQAEFERPGRNMNIIHKKFIVDNSKANIGASQTFRLIKEYCGGYENVGATKQDFKNFQRDLKVYIRDADAQMFVDNFTKKKQMWKSFFFEYEVDDDECLCRAFWCDPICIKNYTIFGDMVSFDTTFKTNRYNMIFGPFTGVDNHANCITFGACLIANEDIASFEWVFSTFIEAMGGKEPLGLITDQDPAMKVAIGNVFKKTHHRFCMWHIMKKMPEKVGRGIAPDFIAKIKNCVWDEELDTNAFEREWTQVVTEFDLVNHDWLSHIFQIRKSWIPAYFSDYFLCGLMKTTSMSESENSFFTSFTNPHLTLVEFYSRFESSLDAQRHTQFKNDNDCHHKRPECKTPILLENDIASFYTNSVFYRVQIEIEAALYTCGLVSLQTMEDGSLVYCIVEMQSSRKNQVHFHDNSKDTSCSCKLFQRKGLPCRHMIWVWKQKLVDRVPDQYKLNRWSKKPTFNCDVHDVVETYHSATMSRKNMLNSMWSVMFECASLSQGHEDLMLDLTKKLHCWKADWEKQLHNFGSSIPSSKVRDIGMLIGADTPVEVYVKPPKISKNKGTGVHYKDKRLKSAREKAIEQNEKGKRQCKTCLQFGFHDSRNCPNKKS